MLFDTCPQYYVLNHIMELEPQYSPEKGNETEVKICMCPMHR